ncbi:MAG: DUF1801 domain-containing protein [Planctomycetes bacterium]|nr:DUF1801 domain-containing protein [Planctomycetota bacterium]
MAKSNKAQSVSELLAALPSDRQAEFEQVRNVIRHNLPPGYEEAVSKNMLVYQVPFEMYSDTYNGHPLWYVALASEKSYLSLHLMSVYGDPKLAKELSDGFKDAGKKLNMGKACVHFHSAQDLALDVIGRIVSKVPIEKWVAIAKAARQTTSKTRRTKA